MKKIIVFVVIILYTTLTGCHLNRKCNPRYNVTEEQVEKDLEKNKNDYLTLIEMTLNKDIQLLEIVYDEEVYSDKEIYIYYYVGNEDDYLTGNYKLEDSKIINLKEVNFFTNEEKDIIESFVEDRNSKVVRIQYGPQETVYFEFWGLTYLKYSDNVFSIEHIPCMNK